MKDPYLYPNSDVLKNLAGVRDSEELKNAKIAVYPQQNHENSMIDET